MKIAADFEITLTDRDEFERLLVQVRWRDIVICELNKERGEQYADMKLFCNDPLYNGRVIQFPADEFMEVMRIAREVLKGL